LPGEVNEALDRVGRVRGLRNGLGTGRILRGASDDKRQHDGGTTAAQRAATLGEAMSNR
jgi:hypothetical protein